MPRPRLFVPGHSHHVTHRGNNRCDVFKDDLDRRKYLSMIRRAARERRVAVHGYTLMTTHVHALVTGYDAKSLPQMMQSLGCRYVRYFNGRHSRTGTLWEGRYWASLIVDERQWLNCLKYIELNPVAARMVASPDDYPWTSYHAHARGAVDPLLTPHPLFLQLGPDAASRAAAWSAFCGQPIAEADLATIREATRRGVTIGRLPDGEQDLMASEEHECAQSGRPDAL